MNWTRISENAGATDPAIIRAKALELLRAGPRPLTEETLRIVTDLVNGGLDRLY